MTLWNRVTIRSRTVAPGHTGHFPRPFTIPTKLPSRLSHRVTLEIALGNTPGCMASFTFGRRLRKECNISFYSCDSRSTAFLFRFIITHMIIYWILLYLLLILRYHIHLKIKIQMVTTRYQFEQNVTLVVILINMRDIDTISCIWKHILFCAF